MADWQTATAPGGQRFVFRSDGDGPAVVLLHGFPDTPHTWDRIAASVAGAGYRAVRPWLRGYHPDTLVAGRGYDASTIGTDPALLLDALGVQDAVLVGHDWGAAITYAAASLTPQRWRAVVPVALPHASLLPRTAKSLWSARHFIGFKMPWAEAMTRRGNFGYIDTLYSRWSPAWSGPDRDACVANFKTCAAVASNLTGSLDYYRALSPKLPRELVRPAAVRALVVGGTADLVDAETFRLTAARMAPGSEAFLIPGAGHWPHREGEAAFTERLVQFLGEIS
jgi:pimeloyl-ACP methyl ester carboxylesterase